VNSTTQTTKTCNRCNHLLPVDRFYPQHHGYLQPCKACRSEIAKEWWRATHPEPQKRLTDDVPTGHKRCGSCQRVLPRTDFAIRKRGGVVYQCRECARARKRRYNEANREKRKVYDRRYYQENTDACKARIRQSVAAKPDKYRAIHSTWKRENKDAVNASTHKRRARLAGNGGSWTEDEWQRLKARCEWRCLMCGRQEMTDGITLCFDHIIPVSLGGPNIISNGQPLCRSCNSRKHRQVLDLRTDHRKESAS